MSMLAVRVLPAIIGMAALCCFALSLIPFEWAVKLVLESSSGRGASSFSSRFYSIQEKLQFLSCFLLVLAVAARQARQAISIWVETALTPIPRLIYTAFSDFLRDHKTEEAIVFKTLAGITLIGLILRLHFLFDPIEFDEADTLISYASRPLLVGMSWYAMPNNHILHTVVLHFVSKIFGHSEWAIRLPALAAGTVLIPLTYALGKQLYDSRAGLIAASLVASTSVMVHYSVNGRGYTMVCVFTCVLWIIARSLLRESTPPKWVLFSVFIALGFYTIPVFLYPTAGVFLWLAISTTTCPPSARKEFLLSLVSATLAGACLTILLYLPVLLTVGYKSLLLNSYVAPKSWSFFFENTYGGLQSFLDLLAGDFPLPLHIVLAAGLILGLSYKWTGNGYGLPSVVAVLVSSVSLVTIQRVVPFARVWTFLIPLLAITTGSGLSLLADRFNTGIRRFALSLLLLTSVMSFVTWNGEKVRRAPHSKETENVAVWLKKNLQPGDLVAVEMTVGIPLAYYMSRHEVALERSPAPCNAMSLFFKQKEGKVDTGRIFAVTAKGRETLQQVLTTICVKIGTNQSAEHVYKANSLSIHLLKRQSELTLASPK